MNSRAYDKWYKSLNDIIDYIDDVINPDIPRMAPKERKERINEIKFNHLLKSIRLGKLYVN